MMPPRFQKTIKQTDATRLIARYMFILLYGGSRSGKTFLHLRDIVIRAAAVKSRHLVARHHFNHIKQSIVYDTFPKVMTLCFPGVPYHVNKTDWFAELSNGSQIWFMGLDDKERVEKILGNEYSTIFLNEVSEITWMAAEIVMTRLAENVGLDLKMLFDCNPPSIKHWIYSIFFEGLLPGTKEPLRNPHLYGKMQINPPDNLANLTPEFIEILKSLPRAARARFFAGEFQRIVEGALWTWEDIDKARMLNPPKEMDRIVVAVDPPVTSGPDADECGIIVAGAHGQGTGRHAFILQDCSLQGSPLTWGNKVLRAYNIFLADRVVAEVNQGGDLVETNLRNIQNNVSYKSVHATKGKMTRAEPVAALYELGRVHHIGTLSGLEDQLISYVPGVTKKSPDRMDALVWAITELVLSGKQGDWDLI